MQGALPKGAKLEYETENLEYTLTKNYVPDFIITKKDGSVIYIEAKGLGRSFDYDARIKMEAVKEQHPELDIRIVFMRDGVLRRGSQFRASDWATKHGYVFAVGSIPDEWLD